MDEDEEDEDSDRADTMMVRLPPQALPCLFRFAGRVTVILLFLSECRGCHCRAGEGEGRPVCQPQQKAEEDDEKTGNGSVCSASAAQLLRTAESRCCLKREKRTVKADMSLNQ